MVDAVPKGFHTLTPALSIKGANQAIEFYKKAFGAELITKMLGPDGSVVHAEIKIGDSMLFLGDEWPNGPVKSPATLSGVTSSLNIYAPDVDDWYKRAVDAGAKGTMPPSDMFWGDRWAQIVDPFGHVWGIATHIEDVTDEETEVRAKEFFKKMQSGAGCAPEAEKATGA